MIVPDHPQRSRALDPQTSFICEAPAGSGKTELLTQRFLTLLSRVNKPEEILAITFTRKAAGEMRDRILAALAMGLNDTPPDSAHAKTTWTLARFALQQDRDHRWQLLDTPNRLQIKTFDSLCAGLANSLPHHSSFAAPPQVTENSSELYLHATRAFIATLEQECSWSGSLMTLFRLLDNNMSKIENLLQGMLARREAWLPLVVEAGQQRQALEILESFLGNVRQEEIQRLAALIPSACKDKLINMVSYAASQSRQEKLDLSVECCLNLDVKAKDLPADDEQGITQWLAIADTLLTTDGGWRKKLDKRNGFPAGGSDSHEKKARKEKKDQAIALIETLRDIKGLQDALQTVRFLPAEHYDTEQRVLLEALLEVLPVLAAYLNVSFQELGQVDFSEVSIRARQALGQLEDPSELALALDYKIQHILVDEFQDTSPAQVELLERLTEGWQSEDGRTLFCVGDAMQSIYGFREANVGLFLRCIERGLGGVPLEPLKLESNFRSHGSVVAWVNKVFARAFPEKSDVGDGAVAYSPSYATHEGGSESAVEVHGFAGDSARMAEGQYVLDVIQGQRRVDPNGTIAILVRNRKHAEHITPLLKNAGLRYRAVDLEPLSTHAIIQDLMALTHALLTPEDRIAWLAVLRAPWAGLSLSDLNVICNIESQDGRQLTVLEQLCAAVNKYSEAYKAPELGAQEDMFVVPPVSTECGLSEDGQARVGRLLPLLQRAVYEAQRKSLRHWVEGVWISIGGPACLYDSQQIKNAELFFGLLESDSFEVLAKREALEVAVDKLYAAPDPQADDSLQVMTIHKAKGLEFDTVIVPSLGRASGKADQELLAWAERVDSVGKSQLLMAPITVSGRDKDQTRVYLQELQKQRELNESCRLFYVACTRAKKSLYLMAEVKLQDKEEAPCRAPATRSLLATAWDVIKLQVQLHRTEEVADQVPATESFDEYQPPRKAIARLSDDYRRAAAQEGHLLDDYIPYFHHDNAQRVDLDWRDPGPSLVGTVVHRILQDTSLETLEDWSENGVDRHKARWCQLLMNLGMAPSHLAQGVEQITMLINKLVSDREHHWLFDQTLPFRRSEYALTAALGDTFAGGEFTHLVIDLLLTDHSGDTWLIDFKTSLPEQGESEASFLSRMQNQYRDAMMRYRRAAAATGFERPRLALYLPALGRLATYA